MSAAAAVFDMAEASRALALLHPDGHTFELRVPNARLVRYNGRPDPRAGTAFGFFDSAEAALAVLPAFDGAEWPGLYVTLNPVSGALLARAANRIKSADKKSSSTSDRDIERRTAFLIDADPVRPADISATNGEHEAALERITEIRWFLSELGWPEPIMADSGNGGHVVYRVDLPAEDGGLVKGFLSALADAFDDTRVHVDRTVFNAARIVKLWGTAARKGDSTADRPHRMSRILSAPSEWQLVTEEMLRGATAALSSGRPTPVAAPGATKGPSGSFDVRDFIGRHFSDADERTWSSGTRWILDPCPFNSDHKGTSAAILQSSSGVLSFKCQHNGCAGLGWKDLREKYEPRPPRAAPAPASHANTTSAEPRAAFSPWIDPVCFREELRQITRTRVPTGIPTLDRATEGGISGDMVVLLVGPVGSCKTALASQLSRGRALIHGGRVYVYAPDQGGAQYLKRLASTFGDIAEDDDAFAHFLAGVEPVLRVIDERRDGVTIESFRDLVLADGKVKGAVASVIIDTPQTVATLENEEERQRIQKATGIARDLTSGLLVPVYVCSHANRAATAARNKQDRTLARSAGLGDASLEHRAQVMLFMERRDRQDGVTEIDVEIPKATIANLRCRLALDAETWRLREVDLAVAEAEAAEKATRSQNEKDQGKRFGRRAQVKALILAKTIRPVSYVSLIDAWKGTAGDLPKTLAAMVEDGDLDLSYGPPPEGGGWKPKFYDIKVPV